MLSDGLIEGERAPGDMIAPAADDDAADVTVAQGASRATLTMSRVDPILPSALQDRMGRHETAAVEDADDGWTTVAAPHPNLVGGYGRRSGKARGSGGAPRNPGQGRQP